MKLNKNFLVHKSGKDIVVVPTNNAEFSGVIQGNQTLGSLLELLKKDISREELINAMMTKYDASRDILEKEVDSTISRLKEIGAIDE